MALSNKLSNVQLLIFDFDGVFTDNTVIINDKGTESVSCWRGDGIGLQRIKDFGLKACIVSTEKNPVVKARADKLQIHCWQNVADKGAAVIEICAFFNVLTKNAMFVGNDVNDIPAFKVVGVPVAVEDAYPEVYPYVLFRTITSGGRGAVREVCDMVLNAKTINFKAPE